MNKIHQKNKTYDFQCFFLLKDVMLAPKRKKEQVFTSKCNGSQLVVYQTKNTAMEIKQQII